MRMPWTRRGQCEQEAREAAEQRLQAVENDWQHVEREIAVTRREAALNGWTRTVTTIFSGH